ncbi:hypothetical protein PS2_031445 [Malus domestica]
MMGSAQEGEGTTEEAKKSNVAGELEMHQQVRTLNPQIERQLGDLSGTSWKVRNLSFTRTSYRGRSERALALLQTVDADIRAITIL